MSPENGIINRYSLKKYDLLNVDERYRKKISYTMRPRTIDVIGTFTLYQEKNITSKMGPGPAAYEILDAMPKDGKCYYSKFTSSKFAKLTQSERFSESKDSPGPQSYNLRDEFPKSGRYIQSKHLGQGTRPFTQTVRRGFTDVASKGSISN
jgi:hypothetical protein